MLASVAPAEGRVGFGVRGPGGEPPRRVPGVAVGTGSENDSASAHTPSAKLAGMIGDAAEGATGIGPDPCSLI